MTRTPRHRYHDPLDRIWLDTAARIGLRVERSGDAYAATDGRGTLVIGEAAALDPDDCLAQMIFHELCHSLIEGPESFTKPDWGLDNETLRDTPREHACLRLQATLAAPYGLRWFFAPTTDFRAFYDALPEDALQPPHDPSVVAAVLGLQRAERPPWAPHLRRALEATAAVGRATRAVAPAPRSSARNAAAPAPDHGLLPSLWDALEDAPPPHPTGLAPSALPDRHCGTCAWHYHGGRGRPVHRCRQADDARIDPAWPACERWEPELDCQDCGACCREAYHAVEISRREPIVLRHPELVVVDDERVALRRRGERCAALLGGPSAAGALERYRCAVYEARPTPCRDHERQGPHCLTARRRVGLSR